MGQNTVVVAALLVAAVAAVGAARTINYIPMFDFDANLLKTDAKVCIVHKEGNQWVPMNVCPSQQSNPLPMHTHVHRERSGLH